MIKKSRWNLENHLRSTINLKYIDNIVEKENSMNLIQRVKNIGIFAFIFRFNIVKKLMNRNSKTKITMIRIYLLQYLK